MLTAADIMTDDFVTIMPGDTIASAAALMRDQDVGMLAVVDDETNLIGVISDRDIVIHGVSRGHDSSTTPIDVLGFQVAYTVADETDFDSIRRLMTARRLRRLPVVADDGRLIGMVELTEIANRSAAAFFDIVSGPNFSPHP